MEAGRRVTACSFNAQRASPQQEIARIAVDRAGIGDLKGSVSAGTYFICA
jgi:hypothetical protein